MATISGPPVALPHRLRFYDLQIAHIGAGGGIGGDPTWTLPSALKGGDIAIGCCVTRNSSIPASPGGGGASWNHMAGFDTGSSEWHRYWYKVCKDEGTSWNVDVSDTGAAGFMVLRSTNAPLIKLHSFEYNLTVTSPSFTVPGPYGLVCIVFMGAYSGTVSSQNPRFHHAAWMWEEYFVQQSNDEVVSMWWGVFPQGTYDGMYRVMNSTQYDSSAVYVFDFDVGGRR